MVTALPRTGESAVLRAWGKVSAQPTDEVEPRAASFVPDDQKSGTPHPLPSGQHLPLKGKAKYRSPPQPWGEA